MGEPDSPDAIITRLRELATPDERERTSRRIPIDQVIGVRMKFVFDLAKSLRSTSLDDVRTLLRSEWYEARLVAVCILDFRARARAISADDRKALFDLYLAEHEHIDSWDLVDRAAPRVVGDYLLGRSHAPLFMLAHSPSVWERRTAITAAFQLIRAGETDTPIKLLDLLLDDPERFVQTSVGVAVRELRRAAPAEADAFLASHGHRLTATTRRLMADRRKPTPAEGSDPVALRREAVVDQVAHHGDLTTGGDDLTDQPQRVPPSLSRRPADGYRVRAAGQVDPEAAAGRLAEQEREGRRAGRLGTGAPGVRRAGTTGAGTVERHRGRPAVEADLDCQGVRIDPGPVRGGPSYRRVEPRTRARRDGEPRRAGPNGGVGGQFLGV
ncbi:DNA alkylation repair protein [Micromonospora craniellae]|uniref:DNA alkylation repair protein n=1 Tax=Micromonospora craniellae TaxID=2294034 RepID=UPI0018F1ACCA